MVRAKRVYITRLYKKYAYVILLTQLKFVRNKRIGLLKLNCFAVRDQITPVLRLVASRVRSTPFVVYTPFIKRNRSDKKYYLLTKSGIILLV